MKFSNEDSCRIHDELEAGWQKLNSLFHAYKSGALVIENIPEGLKIDEFFFECRKRGLL